MTRRRQTSKWSLEEDQKLVSLVQKYGMKNWALIASKFPSRRGKQCRERWRNQLDPSLSRDPFTEEEDQKILEIVRQEGTRWSYIAELLPGRSENGIKNRYYSNLAKRTSVTQNNNNSIVSNSKKTSTNNTTSNTTTQKKSSKKLRGRPPTVAKKMKRSRSSSVSSRSSSSSSFSCSDDLDTFINDESTPSTPVVPSTPEMTYSAPRVVVPVASSSPSSSVDLLENSSSQTKRLPLKKRRLNNSTVTSSPLATTTTPTTTKSCPVLNYEELEIAAFLADLEKSGSKSQEQQQQKHIVEENDSQLLFDFLPTNSIPTTTTTPKSNDYGSWTEMLKSNPQALVELLNRQWKYIIDIDSHDLKSLPTNTVDTSFTSIPQVTTSLVTTQTEKDVPEEIANNNTNNNNNNTNSIPVSDWTQLVNLTEVE